MTLNRAGEEVRATLPLAEEQRRAMADAAVAAFMRAIGSLEPGALTETQYRRLAFLKYRVGIGEVTA